MDAAEPPGKGRAADTGLQQQAWEDWGAVNPLYAILTDPSLRHGDGDARAFFDGGAGTVHGVLAELDRLGLCRRHERALDFGCGVGRLTWALAGQFDEAVGVDVAQSMIDAARRFHPDVPNLRFEVSRSDDLKRFEDASFDLVLTLLVLQHLPSTSAIEGFLREFVRVLRPGGALVFQLPSRVPAHRPPKPALRSRAGVQARLAAALRRVGVPPQVLYDRLDWVPEMTMLALPEARTGQIVAEAGGRIVHASVPDVDRGGTESRTFFVTR